MGIPNVPGLTQHSTILYFFVIWDVKYRWSIQKPKYEQQRSSGWAINQDLLKVEIMVLTHTVSHRGTTQVLKMLLHQQISNESLSLTGEFKEGLRKAKRAKAEEERKDYYALLQVSFTYVLLQVSLSFTSIFIFLWRFKAWSCSSFCPKTNALFVIRWKRRPRWRRSRKLTEKRR